MILNKKWLVKQIAYSVGMSMDQAERTVDFVAEIVMNEVARDNSVRITGFGTWEPFTRSARGGVDPQHPEKRIEIPEVKIAKFRTGNTFKNIMRDAT